MGDSIAIERVHHALHAPRNIAACIDDGIPGTTLEGCDVAISITYERFYSARRGAVTSAGERGHRMTARESRLYQPASQKKRTADNQDVHDNNSSRWSRRIRKSLSRS